MRGQELFNNILRRQRNDYSASLSLSQSLPIKSRVFLPYTTREIIQACYMNNLGNIQISYSIKNQANFKL